MRKKKELDRTTSDQSMSLLDLKRQRSRRCSMLSRASGYTPGGSNKKYMDDDDFEQFESLMRSDSRIGSGMI